MKPLLTALPFILAASLGTAQIAQSPYDDATTTWTLQSLNGADFEAIATMTFPETGRIAGNATCNSYSGELTATFPDFATGPLITTRMACPDMAAEQDFLEALAVMDTAAHTEDSLTLSGPDGAEMVFTIAE